MYRYFPIFGNNYNTIDGTCVRDYVHIKDICRAILLSANYLFKKINRKIFLNIGNGYGISNLQVVNKLNNYLKINTNKNENRTGPQVRLFQCINSS